jgi:hypothetical protein
MIVIPNGPVSTCTRGCLVPSLSVVEDADQWGGPTNEVTPVMSAGTGLADINSDWWEPGEILLGHSVLFLFRQAVGHAPGHPGRDLEASGLA